MVLAVDILVFLMELFYNLMHYLSPVEEEAVVILLMAEQVEV